MRWMVASVLVVGACASPPLPIIDMEGVDPVQYNRDLAECYNDPPVFEFGNYLTNCMEERGYNALANR